MTVVAPQLDYAPGAPIRRRRRVRRVMGLLLLAGLVLAGWWFHAPVWQRVKLLYYQRQCLNYSAPPERVVYDEDNGTVSPLIGTAGYWSQPAFSLNGSTAPTVAVRPAQELGNYFAAMQYPLWAPPATIFMHEMRTKSGRVRLVAVMRWPVNTSYILYEFGLTPTVIKPAGLSRPVIYPPRRGNLVAGCRGEPRRQAEPPLLCWAG